MELSLGFLTICEFRVCIERSGTLAKPEHVLSTSMYNASNRYFLGRGQAIDSEGIESGCLFKCKTIIHDSPERVKYARQISRTSLTCFASSPRAKLKHSRRLCPMTIAICLSIHTKLISFSTTCFRDDRKSAKKQNKTYNILTTIDVSLMYYSPLNENWRLAATIRAEYLFTNVCRIFHSRTFCHKTMMTIV